MMNQKNLKLEWLKWIKNLMKWKQIITKLKKHLIKIKKKLNLLERIWMILNLILN